MRTHPLSRPILLACGMCTLRETQVPLLLCCTSFPALRGPILTVIFRSLVWLTAHNASNDAGAYHLRDPMVSLNSVTSHRKPLNGEGGPAGNGSCLLSASAAAMRSFLASSSSVFLYLRTLCWDKPLRPPASFPTLHFLKELLWYETRSVPLKKLAVIFRCSKSTLRLLVSDYKLSHGCSY